MNHASFHPGLLQSLLWLTVACLSGLTAPHARASYTSIDDIIGTTQAFLEQQVSEYLSNSQIAGRHQIKINRLDPRLRLQSCSEPLQASLENTDTPIGRLSVRVRCNGTAPWGIFVPAQVSLHREIVVTRHPIKRNTQLQTSDLMLAEREISALHQGYLLDIQEAAGALSIRAMSAGQPVLPNQIRIPPTIKRGDKVVITASSGVIRVRMPGEALADGSIGQQIRVRNSRSQRIVHARVVGPGHVEVPM